MTSKYFACFVIICCLLVSQIACNADNTEKTSAEPATKIGQVEDPIARGAYLVLTGGCNDCHSPKMMTAQGPAPDTNRLLSGHQAGTKLPEISYDATKPGNWVLFSPDLTAAVGPWGISFSANITPDSTTGIGAWTEENFIQSIRIGKHMGMATGRPILPPMPWPSIAQLKDEDLKLIFTYLKSIRPIKNPVPQNLPPTEILKVKS